VHGSELARSLPGRRYTDADVFGAELERIFARSWVHVGRSDRVGRPGDYVCPTVGGEGLIIARGPDGSARAFFNVCPHRGTRLCDVDSAGNAAWFRCPYHLWRFDPSGRLISAPMLAELEAAGFDRASGGLRPVRLQELHGSLWVSLASEPAPLAEQVERTIRRRFGQLDTFQRYGMERLATGAAREYEVAANWKLVVENFMECTHCGPIHPDLCRLVPAFRSGRASYHGGEAGVELAPEVDAFTMTGRSSRPPLPTLAAGDHRRFHALVLLPNVLLVLVPDHAVLLTLFPIAPARTRIRCEWLFDPDELARDPNTVGDAVELFDRINRQDWAVLERTQLGVGSRAFAHGGVLAPSEAQIVDFYDFVRERLDGAAP
jgi:Rieske 2Fe-2S family protein